MTSKRVLSSLLVCALILLPVIVYAAGDLPGVGNTAPDFQLTTNEGNYSAMNAVILGLSVDTAESHKSFCAKEGLNFKLLSHPDARVSAAYGSVMEYNGAKLSARNTFIIDPAGKVAKVFAGVKPGGHSEEVLNALASLQQR
jgi:thioredoxin-dependent peroxiredoxin